MKELCHECRPTNKCWFVATVNKRLKALLPSEKQIPITPDSNITKDAFAAHEKIAEDRIRARSYGCPQVNYNPQNPNFQPNL